MYPANSRNLAWGLVPAILFGLLACVRIDLPGLYMDEAYLDSYVPKILDRTKVRDVRTTTFQLADNIFCKSGRFPLTAGIYVGTTATYLSVPYYYVFGMNIFTLRVYHILYGAATVFLVFLILDRIIGRRAAMWGSLLLAVDAGFLIAYRTEAWNDTAHLVFFLASILLALPQGDPPRPTSGLRAFAVGALYGLAGYGYFIYWLFGPPLLLALLLWCKPQLTRRVVWCGIAGFFVGCAPLLYAVYSVHSLAPNQYHGFFKRTGSAASVAVRVRHLFGVLQSVFNDVGYPQHVAGPHAAPLSEAKVYIWLFAAACLPTLWFFKARPRSAKFIATCALLIVGYSVASMKFGTQVSRHHSIVLLPIAYMAVAAMLDALWTEPASPRSTGRRRTSQVLGAAIFASFTFVLAPINLGQHVAFVRQLERTGGVRHYSNAVNFLCTDLLMHHRDDKVVYCDWGYMLPCEFLSRGAIDYVRDIGVSEKGNEEKIGKLFADNPRLTFVLPFAETQTLSATTRKLLRDRIFRLAEAAKFKHKTPEMFYQRDGEPVFETITFFKEAASTSRPGGRATKAATEGPGLRYKP